ncbi:hypothetical protein VIGAN_04116000 [Vigna angularis var. angularis]|uniref:Uncharacterized protein n=1 Tax=Vigna angularis var. angularis TaxID=157739 RepID=A0A0S3RTN8_PHAAN|nr:hypothetical protein VIGAN_04116000 [Vigna angularis var. angularis]
MPQPNVFMIMDKGKDILLALQVEEVGWDGECFVAMYCIRHRATKFNKKFKKCKAQETINKHMYQNSLLFISHV